MYSSSADDSLRFVGQVGVPGDLISPWRSIPPSTNIPYVVTVVENRALFFGDRQSRFAQFPALASVRSGGYEGIATIPVEDAGSVLGVVGLMWSQPQEFDELRQHGITKHVQRVGHCSCAMAATDPNSTGSTRYCGFIWIRGCCWRPSRIRRGSATTSWYRTLPPRWTPDRGSDADCWRSGRPWPTMAPPESLGTLVRAGWPWSATVGEPSAVPWGSRAV